MPGLHQAHGPKAACIQIVGEAAQHRIGILIRIIDKGGEIALSVEHGLPHYLPKERGPRRGAAIPDVIVRHSLRVR